ncbi:hypothetical protein E6O75_ATG02299 [Venturia nashicola]|uniref:Uncharacterized protein n=1 Tax=Venturia nashicola TaxID=86259 RepID=A0A4Z1P585_9PEZI|nr:hypothetical protein E6O75_ATG02299 [Venturia nashicola]
MDANYLQARAASSAADASSLSWMSERSTPKITCTVDRYGRQRCFQRKKSFFHRVGKFILIAVLLFFAIVALLLICCCLKMRKKKSRNVDPNAPPKSGFMGMFGKKHQNQQYNLETAQPGGFYGQPPPQAHLAGR